VGNTQPERSDPPVKALRLLLAVPLPPFTGFSNVTQIDRGVDPSQFGPIFSSQSREPLCSRLKLGLIL
jgi:hypothetical protein